MFGGGCDLLCFFPGWPTSGAKKHLPACGPPSPPPTDPTGVGVPAIPYNLRAQAGSPRQTVATGRISCAVVSDGQCATPTRSPQSSTWPTVASPLQAGRPDHRRHRGVESMSEILYRSGLWAAAVASLPHRSSCRLTGIRGTAGGSELSTRPAIDYLKPAHHGDFSPTIPVATLWSRSRRPGRVWVTVPTELRRQPKPC